MSRVHEIDSLTADIATVRDLLAEAKEIGDPIGEHQYASRVEELEAEVHALQESTEKRARLALLFSGDPVSGSRGIEAEFAGRILEGFQNLIARLFAQEEMGTLGERGKIPFKKETSLMVTGVAHGSFGFTLDEMNDQTDMYETELKTIVSQATDLIVGTSSIDEAEFDARIESLDARTLVALKDVFVEMDGKGAEINIREDEKETYLDKQAIHRARVRIEATQVDEKASIVVGILKGFLPDHRKFELLDEKNQMIYGSATKEAVSQFDTVVLQGGKAIEAPCKAKIQVRTITPVNRPSRQIYRLLSFEVLGGEDAPLVERPEP